MVEKIRGLFLKFGIVEVVEQVTCIGYSKVYVGSTYLLALFSFVFL